ncbi:MAG: hypothetical protein LC660_05865 [Desulfobacteraceae bacterium]|nr:hypothetical protein [Desulfobacteraceae bacterium]
MDDETFACGVFMPKTITIHDELSIKWINQKAKQLNVNLEDLIIKLIHDQMKLDQNRIGLMEYHDLDSLAGTWSSKEADDFLREIDKFNQVDESIWQ